MALQAYRHILRATKLAFDKDYGLLESARTHARETFSKNATLLTAGSAEATAQIAHAEEVARVLRKHVVQGQRIDEIANGSEAGNEEKGDGTYRLRLHPEIERGDNASIKKAPKEKRERAPRRVRPGKVES